MRYRLSLVIPIYNESGNITPLIHTLRKQRDPKDPCPYELILVDNGSTDASLSEIHESTQGEPWIRTLKLNSNQGYGGGVHFGLQHCSSQATHFGWMPADLQYSIEDLHLIWDEVLRNPVALHKGNRTERMDGFQSRFVSHVYSFLCRQLWLLRVRDINGLPKIFPKRLFEEIDFPLAKNFHYDGQMLLAARLLGLPIEEHPVTFYARRAGVSSWSGQKWQVYWQTWKEINKTRKACRKWYLKKDLELASKLPRESSA